MNKIKFLALLMALMLALGAPIACADAAESAPDVETAETAEAADVAEDAEPAAVPAAEDQETAELDVEPNTPDTVLATVNGAEITYEEVKYYYDAIVAQYSGMFDMSDPQISTVIKQMAISYAVTEQVVLQKAQELGVAELSEEDIARLVQEADEAYQGVYDQYLAMFAGQGADEEQQASATEAFLSSNGYTREAVLEQMKSNEVYQRVFATVSDGIALSEDELRQIFDGKVLAAKETYAENLAQFDADSGEGAVYYVPEGVRAVKHILVMMDGAEAAELKSQRATLEAMAEDDEGLSEVQAKIDELMAPVQARLDEIGAKLDAGEDFQALIDEYGEDPGMQEGSPYRETGYYLSEATTTYDPPFQAAAMALTEVGQVSEPVLGAYGFHFIRYDHDLPSGEADFEAVKAELMESELSAKKSEAQSLAVEDWTNAATIETFVERFTD